MYSPDFPDTKVREVSRGRAEMGKRSTLSPDQRSQLVLRLLSKEEPAVRIARRAGISEQTLYRWRDQFISAGKQATNGRGVQSTFTRGGITPSRHEAKNEAVIRALALSS